jgi:hypothetical protein
MLAAAGLVLGLAGVVLLILLVTGGGRFDPESSPLRPADPEFNAGSAEARAATIERDGVPLLFPDPAGGDRPIWLNHLGEDPEEGWVAFDARVGSDCLVEWDAGAEGFVDCRGDRYPPDGEGLRQYDVRVDEGEVVVDLQPDAPTTVSAIPESGAPP